MLLIKDGTKERIKDWKDDSIHVLTDFDRTITAGASESSWSVLSKSNLVSKEYVKERQDLYNYYRPIEIDESMDFEEKNKLMTEWWHKHINLFIKYKLSEDVIKEASNNLRVMSFRKGAKEFLENMHKRNIPVIIISAGIGNFVKEFLIKNECNFPNIYIVSNFIKFENKIATGVIGNVTHSLNKNEVFLPKEIKDIIKNRPNIILLGDSISDTLMAKENERNEALKIGFLEEKIEENKKYYEDTFDIVGINNVGFEDLAQEINILNK